MEVLQEKVEEVVVDHLNLDGVLTQINLMMMRKGHLQIGILIKTLVTKA